MSATVLLVAAEAREFSGLLSRTGSAVLDWPLDFARTVHCDGWRMFIAANGPGPRLAARAVDTALLVTSPDVIVSTGMCGGLAPGLRLGEILVADRVIDGENGREYPAEAMSSSIAHVRGTIISQDRVAVTTSDKRSLRSRGADAVEMEAAAVAALASEKGIPFFCIRSISDTADEELALDFNRFRDADGRFSRSRIAAAALRRPFSTIPGLLRLDRNTRAAAESLGEFLVHCRF